MTVPMVSPGSSGLVSIKAMMFTQKQNIKLHQQPRIKKHMSTLVVVGYDDPFKAEEVRLKLRKLQSEYLLDLADVVIAVKDEKGRLSCTNPLT